MGTEKNQLDYPKISAGLFAILIGITGWFSVTMYEKITKIEENIQQLLVAGGIEKTEITNLKERLNNLENNKEKDKNPKTGFNQEALLPGEISYRNKKEIAYK